MKTENSTPFTNISTAERVVTTLAGAFMIYKALSGEKKRILPALTGACMVLRATTGHCPVYDLMAKREIGR